ncbi:hypothetical protein C8Q72DRAFT_881212 [Fomitopsis betulina]|nr:hypothetical protein C8Q72DRAFT_881212 [Fomitopsis betulina]
MQHEVPSPHDSRPCPPVTPKPKRTKEKTNPLDATTSTPSRASAHASATAKSAPGKGFTWDKHHEWVKEYFPDKVFWGLNPMKLVHGVWGPPASTSESTPFPRRNYMVPAKTYKLDATHEQAFIDACNELQSYPPLVGLFDDLVVQVCGLNGHDGYVPRPYTGTFRIHDKPHVSWITKERMDIMYSSVVQRKGATTDLESAFIEVKKEKVEETQETQVPAEEAQEGKAQEEKAQEEKAQEEKVQEEKAQEEKVQVGKAKTKTKMKTKTKTKARGGKLSHAETGPNDQSANDSDMRTGHWRLSRCSRRRH